MDEHTLRRENCFKDRSNTVKKVPLPFTLVRNGLVVAMDKYRKQAEWVVFPKITTKGMYL